jgi:hypothetical protein
VIAVSEAVRRQLIAVWSLEPEKVVTVASGPGLQAPVGDGRAATSDGRSGRSVASIAPGYVLAVGALEPRKRPDPAR